MAVAVALMSTVAHGQWSPPEKPDPVVILREAQKDIQAKRHADALAKHLWFHENALNYLPSLYGVRLSYALGSWLDLGTQYPPALQALKDVRDRTGSRVREGQGTYADFHDFSSINEVLKEEAATSALFVWLDRNNPELARRSYEIAQAALIEAREYRLCGKYIDSRKSVERMTELYRENRRMAETGRYGAEFKEFTEKSFSYETSTLVALLVLNDRKSEADKVVAAVLKARRDSASDAQLRDARRGVIPPRYPERPG